MPARVCISGNAKDRQQRNAQHVQDGTGMHTQIPDNDTESY